MAIKIKPDFALAHYKLGIALFHAKMTEEAIIPQGLVYHNCTLRHFPAGNGGSNGTGYTC